MGAQKRSTQRVLKIDGNIPLLLLLQHALIRSFVFFLFKTLTSVFFFSLAREERNPFHRWPVRFDGRLLLRRTRRHYVETEEGKRGRTAVSHMEIGLAPPSQQQPAAASRFISYLKFH